MRITGYLFSLLFSLTIATTTSPIKYVIVLMLENRSFDHMLGFLKALNAQVFFLIFSLFDLFSRFVVVYQMMKDVLIILLRMMHLQLK